MDGDLLPLSRESKSRNDCETQPIESTSRHQPALITQPAYTPLLTVNETAAVSPFCLQINMLGFALRPDLRWFLRLSPEDDGLPGLACQILTECPQAEVQVLVRVPGDAQRR
jgi:hypothetical protein